MTKDEMKDKYVDFVNGISKILGLGRPVDIFKLCATTEGDIDDFNNWLKHRPIAEKLYDFFTFDILMPLTTFWYFIQIPFRGLK